MTLDIERLARSLDQAAPDKRIAEKILEQLDEIEKSLRTVGEYAISDDDGNVYVIRANPNNVEQTTVSKAK